MLKMMYIEMCNFREGLKVLDLFLDFIDWAIQLIKLLKLKKGVSDRTFEKYIQNHLSWSIIIYDYKITI